MNFSKAAVVLWALATPMLVSMSAEDIAVQAEIVHTMAGEAVTNGLVLIKGGRIGFVGKAGTVEIPAGARLLKAKVVTPGLIDAHTVVGMAGILNQPHDQEQLEKSAPMQPELRAVDAYNPRDPLVDYVRGFGVTTIHTGHGPGALISGQTMIVKTHPVNLDQALVNPSAMIAVTLGLGAASGDKGKAPGTAPKAVAMLRSELLKGQDYARKQANKELDKRPARDLRLEALGRALDGTQRFLVTVNRHQDILAALRLAAEFKLSIVLDGLSDAPMVLEDLRRSGFPIVLHPTMFRANTETENLSFETASKLKAAGFLFALQSGFESYVPKTRVVLFEAAVAAAHGLSKDDALASITRDAAKLLGIDKRVGSLEPGKDADLALYDGDPFEYTTHCVGVIVNGIVTDAMPR